MAASFEAVHAFWFGGPVSELFRRRWFPCDGAAGQAAADQEVSSRFGATLAAALAGRLGGWADASPAAAVSLVVVLDQFSRHAHRLAAPPGRARDELQAAADAAALAAADALFTGHPGWAEALSPPELVFALMPARHSGARARLAWALATCRAAAGRHAGHGDLLARFERATLRRLREADGGAWTPGDELLAHHGGGGGGGGAGGAAAAGLLRAAARRSPLARPVASFLAEAAPGWAGRAPGACVLVSLSGGVDSMVLAALLRGLGEAASPPFRVAAAHVDYGNRPESGAEAEFVRRWQGIAFRVRRVTEVTRAIAGRDEYERESRRIRYAFYAACLAELCPPGWGALLGHHSGDVAENVLSNLCRRTATLLRAGGMAPTGRVAGVPVWRPLLGLPKASLLAFAHAHGVPYFRDTTPAWSTRGLVRAAALPGLEAAYGAGVGRALAAAAADAADLRAMVQAALLGPFAAAAVSSAAGAHFDAAPWLGQPPLFWREALGPLLRALGHPPPPPGAAGELVARLSRGGGAGAGAGAHPRPGPGHWLPLGRGCVAMVEGTRCALFARGFFGADVGDCGGGGGGGGGGGEGEGGDGGEGEEGGGGGGGGWAACEPPPAAAAAAVGGPPRRLASAPPVPLAPHFRPGALAPLVVAAAAGGARCTGTGGGADVGAAAGGGCAPPAAARRAASASFGPWRLRAEVRLAGDAGADGGGGGTALPQPRLPARPDPLTVWDLLATGVAEYSLPLPPAADAGGEGAGGDGQWAAWLRVARAPLLPGLRALPHRVRAALPLLVAGPDDDDRGDGGGGGEGGEGGGDGGCSFRVRAWAAAQLARPGCVAVRLQFVAPPSPWADGAAGDGGGSAAGEG